MAFNKNQPRDANGRWTAKGPVFHQALSQFKAGALKHGTSGKPIISHRQAHAVAYNMQRRANQKAIKDARARAQNLAVFRRKIAATGGRSAG